MFLYPEALRKMNWTMNHQILNLKTVILIIIIKFSVNCKISFVCALQPLLTILRVIFMIFFYYFEKFTNQQLGALGADFKTIKQLNN